MSWMTLLILIFLTVIVYTFLHLVYFEDVFTIITFDQVSGVFLQTVMNGFDSYIYGTES